MNEYRIKYFENINLVQLLAVFLIVSPMLIITFNIGINHPFAKAACVVSNIICFTVGYPYIARKMEKDMRIIFGSEFATISDGEDIYHNTEKYIYYNAIDDLKLKEIKYDNYILNAGLIMRHNAKDEIKLYVDNKHLYASKSRRNAAGKNFAEFYEFYNELNRRYESARKGA